MASRMFVAVTTGTDIARASPPRSTKAKMGRFSVTPSQTPRPWGRPIPLSQAPLKQH